MKCLPEEASGQQGIWCVGRWWVNWLPAGKEMSGEACGHFDVYSLFIHALCTGPWTEAITEKTLPP